MVSTSFFTDGETYDTAVVTSNDQPASTAPSQAPSGFYPDGTIYNETDPVASATSASQAAASAAAAAASAASASAAVAGAAGTATPLIDGTATVGTSTKWAHEDHVHPTDTSRASVTALGLKADTTYVNTQDALKAPLASPVLTGSPTAPTATAGDNSTKLATTAFVQANASTAVQNAAGTATPQAPGTATVGTGTKWSREDHVHPLPPMVRYDATQPLTGTQQAQARTNLNLGTASGQIGERLTASGTPSFTASATAVNIAFIDLPAGTWDLEYFAVYGGAGATSSSDWITAISTTTASVAVGLVGFVSHTRQPAGTDINVTHTAPRTRVTPASTTRYYLNAQATYTTSSYSVQGTIQATRVSS